MNIDSLSLIYYSKAFLSRMDAAEISPYGVAYNGLHLRRPTAYRKPLMPGHPLGGLMRRPTRLAGGCGQKRPHALLTKTFFMLALYANALLSDAGCPVIQRATGCCPLKSTELYILTVLLISEI